MLFNTSAKKWKTRSNLYLSSQDSKVGQNVKKRPTSGSGLLKAVIVIMMMNLLIDFFDFGHIIYNIIGFSFRGFLHGHVSYISEDCQACLLLLTVQRDAFFPLSQAKHTIAEKLRRSNCLVAINDALNRNEELPTTNPLKHIGIPEIRHFMYKCKSTAQLFTSDPISLDKLQDYRIRHKEGGDICEKKVEKLSDIDYVRNYRQFCAQIHCMSTPAKLIFRSNSLDTILAWVSIFSFCFLFIT